MSAPETGRNQRTDQELARLAAEFLDAHAWRAADRVAFRGAHERAGRYRQRERV